jgi:NAD/NADP transhydrogenase beta subunit
MDFNLLFLFFDVFFSSSNKASTLSVRAKSSTGFYNKIGAANAAQLLSQAKSVIIVPGYGLAVAKAQFIIADIAKVKETI